MYRVLGSVLHIRKQRKADRQIDRHVDTQTSPAALVQRVQANNIPVVTPTTALVLDPQVVNLEHEFQKS